MQEETTLEQYMKVDKGRKHAIWWSVDPFHDDDAFHDHAIEVLMPFARALKAVIRPVTFIDTYRALEPPGQIFPLVPLGSDTFEGLSEVASKRVGRILKRIPSATRGTPIIIVNKAGAAPSLRERITVISTAAQKHSALFVALHSHTHKGLKRFYMGSFAETFALYSSVPTLIFSPTCPAVSKIRRIAFPTDFSVESRNTFRKLQKLFLKLQKRISIIHVHQLYPSKTIAHPKMRAEVEVLERRNAHETEQIAQKARRAGLKAEAAVLESTGLGSPARHILEYCLENEVDLIALAGQSGPLKTTLLGATSRKLARDALCPVLIYRKPALGNTA